MLRRDWMKVIKENGEFGPSIFLQENKKNLAITFGGNGDLFWTIYNKGDIENKENNDDYFIITKENYAIYNLLEQLFYDIENVNIFDEKRDERKLSYRILNRAKSKLYDEEKKTITWYSDETAHEVSNILKKKKEENTFRIEFYTQPYIAGYEEDFHSAGYIPIRFNNSGSAYTPFNITFMDMYNKMSEIDDVMDIGHQIHVEEYLYQKEYVKK